MKLQLKHDRIDKYKTLDFKKLKDAILEVGTIVENALVPYIESPTKSKTGKRASLVCHSELQLASYPSQNDLQFVNATSTLTEANYFNFLEDRKKVILHKFVEALYN